MRREEEEEDAKEDKHLPATSVIRPKEESTARTSSSQKDKGFEVRFQYFCSPNCFARPRSQQKCAMERWWRSTASMTPMLLRRASDDEDDDDNDAAPAVDDDGMLRR
jgi:hypothetical protein